MTPMATEYGYKCSSYRIGYLETTSIGMNMTKQLVFKSNTYFHEEFMILTPKTIDKSPPRDHFVMLDLENRYSSKLRIFIYWLQVVINFQYLHLCHYKVLDNLV